MTNRTQITIGCVGMTHLGLVHAVAFAEKGFDLICYDENTQLINQLQNKQLPVNEPQLDDLVAKNAAYLHFTDDLNQLKQCAAVFIAYDVPTDDHGNSNLDVIHRLLETVKPVLTNTTSLVLLCQVPPGFTREIQFPKDRLFYQVETLVFGRAVERALYPERYIVGAFEPNQNLPEAYAQLLATFDCPILKMRYESAELAKISINMFLVASVTTTNTLAEICENIGADWNDIAPTLRLDKRIGQHAYLTPGLGIAGGNLERDLNTIIKLGQTHATETATVSAWLKNSTYRRDWVLRCLNDHVISKNSVIPSEARDLPSMTSASTPTTVSKALSICILGLAYKPNTHSVKNSPSVALINQLKNYRIKAHDPIVRDQHLTHAIRKDEIFDAVQDADVVIIMTPCAEYQNLSIELLLKHMKGNTIIDPHRLLQVDRNQSNDVNYFSLGQSSIRSDKKELEHA
ncbi:MAG: nucleotide sugar dehydrogenase [Legionellaceae bacterium]|nr:nucleotide sugar dehydrogenase [Legionellaceae bacterium]